MDRATRPRKWGPLILFATVPTLICCVLPIALVSLGFGSVVASLYGKHFTFLQWFGNNADITFGATALILGAAAWAIYRPGRACPTDPDLAAACAAADKWNIRFFWAGIAVGGVGAFAVFVLPHIGV